MAVSNGAMQARMARLARGIEQWREAGRPGKRMPEALWECAVSLAREHGAYRVATETGVNYQNLKRRTEQSWPAPGKKVGSAGVEFVEVDSESLLGATRGGGSGTEIEVQRADGTRLRIRIGAGQELDVARVAAAFAGAGR